MSSSSKPDIIKTIDSWIESLPYKEKDIVWTTYTEPPSDRKIEELEISSACTSGIRVQLEGIKTATGTELWLDSGWIEPITQWLPVRGDLADPAYVFPISLKEEPKAMTDIKWIPVDPENLPEGEVLAISEEGIIKIGNLERQRVGVICFDHDDYISTQAYIPVDHLKQLWANQNPAANYSKDSEAFKLLEWVIDSDSSLGKALGEIPPEAGHTIDILANQIVKLSWLVEDAPRDLSRDSDDFLQELIYWIKDYIAN